MDGYGTFDRIASIVARVPSGRVYTYGSVADDAGFPKGARTVARALHSRSAADKLPWHRIVRRDGSIALAADSGGDEQRARLEAEGVTFDSSGRVDLSRYLWDGESKL
jgi:methylated-DNA-protein-cysteine methyltransferase-like protein